MFSPSSYLLSVIRRMTSARNVAVVLAAHGAPMVSIDISVAVPGKAPPPAAAAASSSAPSSTSSSSSATNIARVVEKNMLRVRDDSALQTLERLRLLLGPPDLLKSRAAKKTREELLSHCPTAELLDADGNVIEDLQSLSNEVAWRTAKTIRLGANTSSPLLVPIRYNLPTVTAVQPPNIVFAGVPCVCTSVTTMFAGEHDLLYEWRLAPPVAASSHQHHGGGRNAPPTHTPPPAAPAPAAVVDDSPPLSTESVLLPPASALGRRLRFRVRVNSPDSMWTEVESPPVLPTPRGFEPQPRWALVKPRSKDASSIRVCTYNILHDGFATSKRSRAKMYPFASNDVLDINYRRARVAQELIVYDADIVGLQEVGRSVFDGYLEPILRSRGFVCKLRMKNNQSKEGVALLLRRERFEVERWVDLTLNLKELTRLIESLKQRAAAADASGDNQDDEAKKRKHNSDTAQQLEQVVSNAQFREAMEQVPSVGLICVAYDKLAGRRVIIGNTHLYYHALGCHIRLVQSFLLSHRMQDVAEEMSRVPAPIVDAAAAVPEGKSGKGAGEGVIEATTTTTAAAAVLVPTEQILLGDFNFTRPTGGYSLMTQGFVDKEHISWEKSEKYFWNIDATIKGAPASDAEGLTLLEDEEDEREFVPPVEKDDDDDDNTKKKKDDDEGDAKPVRAPSSTRVALELQLPQQQEQQPTSGGDKNNFFFTDVYANEPSLTCTNYALWFKEIIDHIFVSKGIKATSVLPAPSQQELSENIAIPSHVFPSDHIALVADLQFRGDNDESK